MPILISSSSFDDHFRTKSIQFSHLPHNLVIYNSNSFVTPPAYITAKAISFLAIIFVKFSFKFVPYLYSCDLWLVISLFLQPFFNYFFTFRSTSHAHTSTPPHAQKHRQIHTHTHTHTHTCTHTHTHIIMHTLVRQSVLRPTNVTYTYIIKPEAIDCRCGTIVLRNFFCCLSYNSMSCIPHSQN